MEEYIKFLHSKLYLIEILSGQSLNDEKFKQIHDICIASPSQIDTIYKDRLNGILKW